MKGTLGSIAVIISGGIVVPGVLFATFMLFRNIPELSMPLELRIEWNVLLASMMAFCSYRLGASKYSLDSELGTRATLPWMVMVIPVYAMFGHYFGKHYGANGLWLGMIIPLVFFVSAPSVIAFHAASKKLEESVSEGVSALG